MGGGGPGQSDKKKLRRFFCFLLFIFLVLSLHYRSQMVNFKEIYHFLGSRGGPTFFRGVQLFRGGSNCLFSIETHITCDFPGGGFEPPVPPLDPHLLNNSQLTSRDGQMDVHAPAYCTRG